MEDYKALIKTVLEQESLLTFPKFDADDALAVGLLLIEECKKRGDKFGLQIYAYGRVMFQYSGLLGAPSHDCWIVRKQNTVNYCNHSSQYARFFLADQQKTIQERWLLDPMTHTSYGGGFPLNVAGCGGMVGTIVVSGFPGNGDHNALVTALARYLKKEIPQLPEA